MGKVVLDAGCGTAKLTCGMATWGGEAVGLDLAPAAVRGWRQRGSLAGARGGHVHVVQGDVMRPPFRDASFDGVHSSGVLHHTPDTRHALAAVGALVKPGGSLAVWLYHHGPPTRVPWLPFVRARWAAVPESFLRPWTTRLPPRILFALIHTYALAFHAFYSMGARLRGTRHEQTARERATSLFDSLAPPFVWRHRPERCARGSASWASRRCERRLCRMKPLGLRSPVCASKPVESTSPGPRNWTGRSLS